MSLIKKHNRQLIELSKEDELRIEYKAYKGMQVMKVFQSLHPTIYSETKEVELFIIDGQFVQHKNPSEFHIKENMSTINLSGQNDVESVHFPEEHRAKELIMNYHVELRGDPKDCHIEYIMKEEK